jgi:hypothetical protein
MASKRLGMEMEEYLNRYAESALISAIRLRRYWMSQGCSEKEAISRAVKQAAGMMASSGVPLQKLIELFQQLEKASSAFREMLINVEKNLAGGGRKSK